MPLSFPAYPQPRTVVVRRRTAAALVESPTNYSQQIYQHPGKRWEIDVTLQRCTAAEAAAWTAFFYALEGVVGTFDFNLTPWCPGLSPAPGTVTFRLTEPSIGWSAEHAQLFDFRFSAVQAL